MPLLKKENQSGKADNKNYILGNIEESQMSKLKSDQSVEDIILEAQSLARKYNSEGWGSRAAVMHAIYDLFETGISEDAFVLICSIMDGFHASSSAIYEDSEGRGYGITACGALNGALAAFAMVFGKKNYPFPFWTEGMKPNGWITRVMNDSNSTPKIMAQSFIDHTRPLGYGGYFQIVSRFKEHFDTTDCLDLVKPFGHYVTHQCFKNCHKIIIWTAGMAAKIIMEYDNDPDSLNIDNRNPHLFILRD